MLDNLEHAFIFEYDGVKWIETNELKPPESESTIRFLEVRCRSLVRIKAVIGTRQEEYMFFMMSGNNWA